MGAPLDQALSDLNRQISIPAGGLGVTRAHIPAIVEEGALRDRCRRTNPRIATPRYALLIEEDATEHADRTG